MLLKNVGKRRRAKNPHGLVLMFLNGMKVSLVKFLISLINP